MKKLSLSIMCLTVLVLAAILSIMTVGCSSETQTSSKETEEKETEKKTKTIDTDDIYIGEYDGVEIEAVEKTEVTDEDVQEYIDSFTDEADRSEDYEAEIPTEEEAREYLEEQAQSEYDNEVTSEAWDVVMNNTEVKKYDEDEVQEMSDSIDSENRFYAEYYGVEDFSEFITDYMGLEDEEAYNAELEETAKEYVKQRMASDAIADAENIEPEDYDKQVQEMAEYFGYEDTDSFIEDYGEENIMTSLRETQAMYWVGEHAVQVESETVEITDLESSSSNEED